MFLPKHVLYVYTILSATKNLYMSHPPRKILHLKEKCSRITNKKTNLDVFSKHKGSFSQKRDSLNFLANNNSILNKLYQKRLVVLSEIAMLEQRLIFTSSMPLKQACNELKKKDIDILCRINECLIAHDN